LEVLEQVYWPFLATISLGEGFYYSDMSCGDESFSRTCLFKLTLLTVFSDEEGKDTALEPIFPLKILPNIKQFCTPCFIKGFELENSSLSVRLKELLSTSGRMFRLKILIET
jgi:hypothetical protein